MTRRKPTLSQRLRQLARHTAELERSNCELDQFVSVVTHDLQAPLRAVASYCQLLQRECAGKLSQEEDWHLTHAVEGAKRMQRLINDLCDYARGTRKPEALEPVDCDAVLTDALANLKAEIDSSGAAVTHDHLPKVPGDKSQLTQLFQNLIANAIKFRGNRPLEVRIFADAKHDAWQFSVWDNGIGFDQKHAKHIFDIFRRLHTHEEQFNGTGVGLAICKRIVARHGGRIYARSKPGEGSVFRFTISKRTGIGNGN